MYITWMVLKDCLVWLFLAHVSNPYKQGCILLVYGKSCISSYSKKFFFSSVNELLIFFFLGGGGGGGGGEMSLYELIK